MTHERKPGAELRRRQLTLAVGATALVGGLGCATYLTAQMPNTHIKKVTEGEVVLTDTILGLGKLNPELAASVRNPDAVAFLGKAHSYFLAEGGRQLLNMAQQLDNDRLSIESDVQHRLLLRDQTVWGFVVLRYEALPAGAPAPRIEQERTLLRKLGFLPAGQGHYRAQVSVRGVMRPPLPLPATMPALRRTPEIVFRAPPTVERTPNVDKFILLPLAVTVDILAAPLYVAGLLVFGIGALAH